MPIIYSYPNKISPSSGDLLIISDVSASNQTKKVTIGDLKDPLDVVDAIIPGDGISVSSPTGDVTISNTGVLDVEVGSFIGSFGIPLASVDVGGGTTRLFLYKYTGGSNVGFVPSGGNSNTFLKGNGTWAVPTQASPSLPQNGVQYRNANGNFEASTSLIFESNNGTLIVGDQANDIFGIIEIQSDNDSGAELKIQGGGGFYTTIRGSQVDTASYIITLPVSGPGGNDKILQSNSSGELSWIDTPTGGSGGGVSSFTNTNGTYISAGTENAAATGAVTVGTIDLSAVDGSSDTSTRFLSKDNTWDVPSYTTFLHQGFNTFSIYSAQFPINNPDGQPARTIIRQSVVEHDCEINAVDYFRLEGQTPISVFIYSGTIQGGGLLVTWGTEDMAVNQAVFQPTEKIVNTIDLLQKSFKAGDDIVIVVSFADGAYTNGGVGTPGLSLAGSKGIGNMSISRTNDQWMVPQLDPNDQNYINANPPSDSLVDFLAQTNAETVSIEGVALHFYYKE